MAHHEESVMGNPTGTDETTSLIIPSSSNDNSLYKVYPQKKTVILRKVPIRGVVIVHDHRLSFSVDKAGREALRLVGVGDKARVIVEDPGRGLAFQSTVKVLPTRAYIHIPKTLWGFYDKGDVAWIIITPIP